MTVRQFFHGPKLVETQNYWGDEANFLFNIFQRKKGPTFYNLVVIFTFDHLTVVSTVIILSKVKQHFYSYLQINEQC